MNYDKIRNELTLSITNYAKVKKLPFKAHKTAIIFDNIEDNFYLKSFENIKDNSKWIFRLNKKHGNVPGANEMQSSNSSDALLMNIFCHPDISKWLGVKKLLNLTNINSIEFGHNPVIYKSGKIEPKQTEIDLLLNSNIICESKLTESDFTNKNKKDVEKYDHFEDIFYKSFLKQNRTEYENYQLIRNVLALFSGHNRFILFCDERRPDLIIRFYETVKCIKDITLRSKCGVITWQQIATVVGKDLKLFLFEKYGIIG